MMLEARQREGWILFALLAAALLLTTVVYLPSLYGGYVFDDYANILENKGVHVTTLDFESLRRAALASPSPLFVRPLAMLSFGLDWYIADGSPYEMRVVNLAIHLINGLVLFALLRRIVRIAWMSSDTSNDSRRSDILAVFITAAWLLAPINFTAVAYIVQRMESLCQLFVLCGLLGYVVARERMGTARRDFASAAASIVLGTSLGALAKESAVLLPLYAFIVEWALFGFATNGRTDRRYVALYVTVLLIPGAIAAAWLTTHALSPQAWVNRPFTLGERLLTEPRILFNYIGWSLLPTPDALGLYHDQFALSKGLLRPPATLASIVALFGLAGTAIWLRRKQPLAALGIGWFLSAHTLTATVIPLELVFEHRNYFASIGVYLVLFPLLIPSTSAILALSRVTTAVAVIALFAAVTWVRALDWSDPVVFAASEARKNPDSPRAAYELARTYVLLSRYQRESPFVQEAYAALQRAAAMPGATAMPDQGLLVLSGRLHEAPPAGTWERFREKIATQPLSAENISSLHTLTECAVEQSCIFPADQMTGAFAAALQHSPSATPILSTYANYAINVLHDGRLAVDLARECVERDPRSLQARRNLILLLAVTGHRDEAAALLTHTLEDVPEAARDEDFRAWAKATLGGALGDND